MKVKSEARPVVLIADDSPEYLDMLGAILAPEYQVRVANSGRRALQLARQEPIPDVILLDVLMPDMDGHEVLADLRQDPVTRGIPAIFVTSMDEMGDELTGLTLGAADYIVKPAHPAIVRARVGAQVSLKRNSDRLRDNNLQLLEEIGTRLNLEQGLRMKVDELEALCHSISHDLRAPLAAIGIFASTLQESEAPQLSERGRHQLDRINVGARRMSGMIDDILECARADRAVVELKAVRLGKLVADAVEDCSVRYPRTTVVVSALPDVLGDAAMLRQAIANLVSNAFKFSALGDRPTVEIFCESRPEEVVVHVRDNGVGFDPAYAHRLFGMFRRLHKDSEFPGTGVGLAIVKKLIARQGGTVKGLSAAGLTTFSMTLRRTPTGDDRGLHAAHPGADGCAPARSRARNIARSLPQPSKNNTRN